MRPVLALVCCACLGGKKPAYDFYVLTPTAAAETTSGELDQPTVVVSQVTIPRYLDRDSIVTRADDYRILYSSVERWAEPLDEGIARTLRQDLAATLAPAGITVPSRTGAPTYDLQVDVLRFERSGTDHVELWARWTLRSGEVSQTQEARIRVAIAGTTSSAAAAALSRAVGDLAAQIAGQVRTVEAAREDGEAEGKAEPHS